MSKLNSQVFVWAIFATLGAASFAPTSWAKTVHQTETTQIGPEGKGFNNRDFLEHSFTTPVRLTKVTVFNRHADFRATATLTINSGAGFVSNAIQTVPSGGANTWEANVDNTTNFRITIDKVDPKITSVVWEYDIDVDPTVVTREVQVEVPQKVLKELAKEIFSSSVTLYRQLSITKENPGLIGQAITKSLLIARDLRINSDVSGDVAFFNTRDAARLLDTLDSEDVRTAIDAYYLPDNVGTSTMEAIDKFREALAHLRERTKYFVLLQFSIATPQK